MPLPRAQYDTPFERRDVLGVHAQKQEGFSWVGACVPTGRLFPQDFYDFADVAEKCASLSPCHTSKHVCACIASGPMQPGGAGCPGHCRWQKAGFGKKRGFTAVVLACLLPGFVPSA